VKHESEQLKTVQETADQLGMAPVTIRTWMAARRIDYVKLGRSVRIPQREIVRIVEEGLTPRKVA
jgi:excisionase family DNA binding protein